MCKCDYSLKCGKRDYALPVNKHKKKSSRQHSVRPSKVIQHHHDAQGTCPIRHIYENTFQEMVWFTYTFLPASRTHCNFDHLIHPEAKTQHHKPTHLARHVQQTKTRCNMLCLSREGTRLARSKFECPAGRLPPGRERPGSQYHQSNAVLEWCCCLKNTILVKKI